MTGNGFFWEIAMIVAAGTIVALMALRGWRMGVVRQALSILAIAMAYIAGWFGGGLLVPPLRILGMPDGLLRIVGGVIVGLFVFLMVTVTAALVFKRTAQQSIGIVRLGYGASGAVLGTAFGLFLVWLCALAIRVLGTLAEIELGVAEKPRMTDGRPTPRPVPSPIIRGLAEMKQALETGATGQVMQRVDPVPTNVYSTVSKLGQMVSSEESIDRFMAHPGVQELVKHPKLVELLRDPDIERELIAHNFVALLRDPRLVAAANDPDLAAAISKIDFQKALDDAVGDAEKPAATPTPQ